MQPGPADAEEHNYAALYAAATCLPEVVVEIKGHRARVLGGHRASCASIFVLPVEVSAATAH